MAYPVFIVDDGSYLTRIVACMDRKAAASLLGVDERAVRISTNPATGRIANRRLGEVLTRDIREGPGFK